MSTPTLAGSFGAALEAKLTQDDGTARDKVARVLRLAADWDPRERRDDRSFEVIACISRRGFGVRASDMEDLLVATRGKGFHAVSRRSTCRMYHVP